MKHQSAGFTVGPRRPQNRSVFEQEAREGRRKERPTQRDHQRVRKACAQSEDARNRREKEHKVAGYGQRRGLERPPRMTQCCACHHAHDHGREHADGECVQPEGRNGRPRQQRGALERKPDGQPGVAHMQDPHDRKLHRSGAAPLRQTY